MIPIRGAPAKNRWPWVTLGLIAVNLAIFLYQLHIGPDASTDLFYKKGAVASKLSRLKVLSLRQSLGLLPTMFSSLFLHAGWVHLIGNMWFLWVFGEALEDDLGHGRFLGFYLFCGFFACIFHVLAASSLAVPLIGASGAIAGSWGVPDPAAQVQYLDHRLLEAASGEGVHSRGRLAGAVAGAAVLRPQERRPRGLDGPPGGFFIGMATVNLFTPLTPAPAHTKAGPKKPASAKGKKK